MASTAVLPPGVSPVSKAPRFPLSNKLSIVATFALIPSSIYCLHSLALRNDYFHLMQHLRDYGPSYLPGSTPEIYTRLSSDPEHPSYPASGDEVIKIFTGYPEVDYWLRVLNCFFAPVFRDEELTALCVAFTGLFGVVVTLLYVEGQRRWMGWRMVFNVPTAWGLACQGGAFGFIMSCYAFLYLFATGNKPSTITALSPSSTPYIRALPASLVLGYVVPTFAMWYSNRAFHTTTHQYLVAVWQAFPVYIVILQFLLSKAAAAVPGRVQTKEALHQAQERLYQFLIYFSRAFHMGTIFYVLTSFYRLSESSTRTPIKADRLLLFSNPIDVTPVKSFADGTLAFLQYDFLFGTVATLILLFAARRKAVLEAEARGKGIHRGEVALDRVVTGLLEGPGAVVAKMAWERDALVWNLAEGQAAKKAL